ncbi:hypothetical protein, partial [Klebsiella pneumoniae]|uniref:hypothetical protein n=1 Tax=Klebsiella pneumoniae TaxID=573 RepID=UPI003B5A3CAE
VGVGIPGVALVAIDGNTHRGVETSAYGNAQSSFRRAFGHRGSAAPATGVKKPARPSGVAGF